MVRKSLDFKIDSFFFQVEVLFFFKLKQETTSSGAGHLLALVGFFEKPKLHDFLFKVGIIDERRVFAKDWTKSLKNDKIVQISKRSFSKSYSVHTPLATKNKLVTG